MAAVAVDGVIHALGGATGATAENRHTIAVHHVYDPKANVWTDSTPLPFPREHFNVLVLNGKLYAIGGRIGNFSQNLQTVLMLDLHDNLPFERARHARRARIVFFRAGSRV
jgi:hypothetical protein